MTDKSPTAIDEHVGCRIRMRRLMLGMNQAALAEALGISFQQVQKYEKGRNRMAPSRLLQAAHVLGVSVPFFFEGLDGTASEQGEDDTPQLGAINEFVSSHEGVRLIKAFSRIKSSAMRRSIVGLVEELALRDGE